jgi:hypothetical protein
MRVRGHAAVEDFGTTRNMACTKKHGLEVCTPSFAENSKLRLPKENIGVPLATVNSQSTDSCCSRWGETALVFVYRKISETDSDRTSDFIHLCFFIGIRSLNSRKWFAAPSISEIFLYFSLHPNKSM